MGRKVAMLLHASVSVGAGVLFFYFVLPRWPELMGDTSHKLGTALRVTTGVLIGLAALPVLFTLLRTRRPELGTPKLALTLRTWSIVGHVLAGVLIAGTAISEIWLNVDTFGRWLFAIYGAAAAIAVLGFFAFYLSFIAELPPPPPKPLKPKKEKERRVRRQKKGAEATDDLDEDEEVEGDEAESEEAEPQEAETQEAQTQEAQVAEPAETVAESDAQEPTPTAPTVKAAAAEEERPKPDAAETVEAPAAEDEPRAGLRNRRPSGKTSHRRRRTRGGVAVDE
ncbi:hypothetical protein [Mycobacterium sp. 1423905.2]|uniref:hypothetical protein n=1 Tax=Mycobacterium sp. 1423905.2 TaxID=1856859 RepID=UPI000801FB07|nr:hypothetical protein [Mycobacterium sp. 1423905.2]OBJ62778.1 hypothetical protein A9W95_07835 [Mycobacterium sp. 1423905.2]